MGTRQYEEKPAAMEVETWICVEGKMPLKVTTAPLSMNRLALSPLRGWQCSDSCITTIPDIVSSFLQSQAHSCQHSHTVSCVLINFSKHLMDSCHGVKGGGGREGGNIFQDGVKVVSE